MPRVCCGQAAMEALGEGPDEAHHGCHIKLGCQNGYTYISIVIIWFAQYRNLNSQIILA